MHDQPRNRDTEVIGERPAEITDCRLATGTDDDIAAPGAFTADDAEGDDHAHRR
jgi:hypothetical protein